MWQSKKRAKTFDRKVRVGDWEGDLIGGKDNCQTIVSLVDRKSRLTLLHKVSGKTEQEVSAALIFRLQEDEGCVKTITFDNGLEFAGHSKVAAATVARIYFCRPYHSWETGLNEQTNSLVRQYLLKGSCFQYLTEADMRRVEERLNKRPRKVLDYKAPSQVFTWAYTRRSVARRVWLRAFLSSLLLLFVVVSADALLRPVVLLYYLKAMAHIASPRYTNTEAPKV